VSRDSDDQTTHEAATAADGRYAFTYYACWICILGSLAGAVIVAFTGTWILLLGAGGLTAVGLAGLSLLRAKHERAAYRMISVGALVVVLAEPAFSNGLFSALLVALPMVLLLTAWLLGTRASLWAGAAALPVLFAYSWAHLHGLLGIGDQLPADARALVLALIIAAATALGYFAARTLGKQLHELDQIRRELEGNVAKLAKRDEELSLLTERVPAMIARFDQVGICRFANSAYARFHGWGVDTILGRGAREVIGDAAYRDIERGIKQALAGGPNQQVVTRSNVAGEPRVLASELVPSYRSSGEVDGWYALIRDVTESERAHRALRHIVEGTARATGTDYFKALAKNLAQATGLAHAMIAEVLPDPLRAHSLAHWTGSDFRERALDSLDGTPGMQVLQLGEACVPDRVAELFPQERALAADGIRGYYGLRLDALEGTPMGLLVVMDRAPIRNREAIASLVSVFAARAAAEIERIRAEAESHRAAERFAKVFQNSPVPITITSLAEGRFIDVNQACVTTFGWPRDEIIGRTAVEIGLWPGEQSRAKWAGHLGASRIHEVELTLYNVRREPRSVRLSADTIELDGVPHIISFIYDETLRKQATEHARELNVRLEARVAERTTELAELNRELEAFSYSVSHDLRAPLRSIQGFGSILEERYAAQLDATARDYVQRMVRAAQRLAHLIDDLLELTRINRAEINPVEVDLSTMAREILDELAHGAPQRQVRVHVDDGVKGRGDPQLLRIAMQNLLDNAWKYSGKVSDAALEFGSRQTDGERVYCVRDNGAGFDMAYADKLFTPFQRLHNPRDFEGTGIGLATVARVVHRHGGRVWAHSTPGAGAEFFFTLGH
jgi:PAS domain S-box-containing protein